MSATDWQGLCEELVNALDAWQLGGSPLEDEVEQRLIDRTRALLAQPEPEVGPTDEELLKLWNDCDLGWDEQKGMVVMPHIADYARAVLARWGRPAPAPAGEVAELARLLRLDAELERSDGMPQAAARFDRAADLLECLAASVPMPTNERNWDSILSPSGGYEMADDAALRDGAQLVNGEWLAPVFGCDSLESALDRIRERLERQAAPVPVAVSERPWERDGWCHPQERWAWFYNRRVGWRDAIPPESLKPPTLFPYTHSLPFNALPLPSGEVQP